MSKNAYTLVAALTSAVIWVAYANFKLDTHQLQQVPIIIHILVGSLSGGVASRIMTTDGYADANRAVENVFFPWLANAIGALIAAAIANWANVMVHALPISLFVSSLFSLLSSGLIIFFLAALFDSGGPSFDF